ncbi:MAG: xanthine dehydrogenase family protein subunit M [Rubrivivax sp.]
MDAFDYVRPGSLQELVRGLGEAGAEGAVLAGGTDLHVKLRAGKMRPRVLFDVSELAPLRAIVLKDGMLRIGAAARVTEIAASPAVRGALPALVSAVSEMSSRQIRNRATVGGNIVTASPAADAVPPLLAADAVVVLVGPEGGREVALADFIVGPGKTAKRPSEVVAEVAVPVGAMSRRSQFVKIGRRKAQAISVVNLAGCVEMEADGRVRDLRIALGAVAPTAMRAHRAEAALRGRKPSAGNLREAAAIAAQECRPISDIRATADGRRRLVEAWTLRMLQTLTGPPSVGRGADQ